MKFTVNTAKLNSEQMKFLSQLGEFRDNDETWVAGCEPLEFDEAMEWLRWAGIRDLFMGVKPLPTSSASRIIQRLYFITKG